EARLLQPRQQLRALLAESPPVLVAGAGGLLFEVIGLALEPGDLLQPRRDRLAVRLVELLAQSGEAVGEVFALGPVAADARLLKPRDGVRQVFLPQESGSFTGGVGVGRLARAGGVLEHILERLRV